jgi:hypothetical protein
MVYWRKEYFQPCKDIIASGNDAVPKEHLRKLWEWVVQQEDGLLDDTINNFDSRRVGLMIEIPQKEDLARGGVECLVVKAGEQNQWRNS